MSSSRYFNLRTGAWQERRSEHLIRDSWRRQPRATAGIRYRADSRHAGQMLFEPHCTAAISSRYGLGSPILTQLSKCLSPLVTLISLCPDPLSVTQLNNSHSFCLFLFLNFCDLWLGQPRASCVGGWVCLVPAPPMGGGCCLVSSQSVPSHFSWIFSLTLLAVERWGPTE